MKRAIIEKNSQLKLIEVESRKLKPYELRVKVAVSAVCGSDLKLINQGGKHDNCSFTPGHEFSGKVVESYDGITMLNQRVTAFPMFSCLKCDACKRCDYRECNNKKSLGYDLHGSFAEEVIIDSRFAVCLNDQISYEEGAMVEHLCCGFRLAKDVEKLVKFDERVLIIGDGPIALADVKFLKLRGFKNITLIGKHRERMDFADKLGADKVVHYDEFVDCINDQFVENELFDAAILSMSDCSVFQIIINSLGFGVKVFPQARIDEKYTALLEEVKGAVFGRAFAYHIRDFKAVMDLIASGEVKAEDLITSKVCLGDIEDSMSLIFDKSSIKTIVSVLDICA